MKTLPSILFPNCEFSEDKYSGLYDVIPKGFDHIVSLYLSDKTVKDDEAVMKAANFFDEIHKLDDFCRNIFSSVKSGSKDFKMVNDYFDFYIDETPEVFNINDISKLTLVDKVKCLKLIGMASHEIGLEQYFVVDFTLGPDQLLCGYFDCNMKFSHIAWES